MENRSWRIARRNGFTAVETVVTVIVLAILAAYATPKLFGLKEQADETEETLKIKDIEARHSQEILKAGKRGAHPMLGDVVGFRPEVVAEPAPDTAPMLVDWAWSTPLTYYWRTVSTLTHGYPLSLAEEPEGIFRCAGLNYISSAYRDQTVVKLWTSFDRQFRVVRFDAVPDGPVDGRSIPDVGPHCNINYRAELFSPSSTQTLKGYPWNAKGTLEIFEMTPTGSTLKSYGASSEVPSSSYSYTDTYGATGSETQVQANRWRLNCKPYSDRYGVTYVTKEWRSNGSLLSTTFYNEKETTQWFAVPTLLNSDPRVTVINSSPLQTIRNFTLPMLYPTYAFGHCERVGPAPTVPPSDPGDPGNYPMAADGSGYCLSPGRKLPTYKDSAGTPTGSASDPVVELATEAVDDPTNCPG